MTISFSKALGIHEQALQMREQRSEIIANNIANADTPGFKARDIDFRSELQRLAENNSQAMLRTSNVKHFAASPSADVGDRITLSYRVPAQASLDGNTVDEQQENASFARNALDHQASFQFLNGKFMGLIKALRGE